MSKAWMPFYGGDFLSNTLHLSGAEIGYYILLLWHCWENEGRVPDDDAILIRIARIHPPHWPKVRRILEPLFDLTKTPGSWTSKRVVQELTKAAEISNKRKDAALQKHIKISANAEQLHTQSQSQSQSHKKEREEVARDARSVGRGSVCPPDFSPSPDHYQAGGALGFSSLDVDELAAEMRRWSEGNANRAVARKSDWSATFYNWIKRKAKERGTIDVQAAKERRKSESRAALEQLRAFGEGRNNGDFGQSSIRVLPRPGISIERENISGWGSGIILPLPGRNNSESG